MILVTGAAGYIGSHICNKLYEKKIDFFSIDNLSGGRIENIVHKKKFKKIDYSSKKILKLLIEKKINIIIHAAAYTFPNESEINKKKYFLNNISKNIKFIDYCYKLKIKNFIFFSTSNVYSFGSKKIKPINEKGKIKPKNYYGYTKFFIENYIQKKNLFPNLAILRVFNIAGFTKNFKFVEFKTRFRRIMPTLATAIKNEKTLNIYGTYENKIFKYSVRDYLHIEDFTDLIIKFIKYKKNKGIYNVGLGKCYSLKEIINTFQAEMNIKIKYTMKRLRKGELGYTLCQNTKVKKKFNWKPKKKLINIVKSTIKWGNI
jgi:UDP-glucose 4-epimerase